MTMHPVDVGDSAGAEGLRHAYADLAEQARAAERAGDGARALLLYEQALDLVDDPEADPLAADALRWIGTIHRERGETTEADRYYRRGLAVAERAAYASGVAHSVNCLAILAMRRGLLTEAEVAFKRAARLASAVPDESLAGMVEQNLGILANIRGDLDGASIRYRAALGRFRAAGDAARQAIVLNNLGMLHTDLHEWKEADACYSEAASVAVMLNDLWLENAIEVNRAELEAARADWAAAARKAARARELARRRDDRLREAEALRWLARAEGERGRKAKAARDLAEADRLCLASEDRLLEAEIAREFGNLLRRAGREIEAHAAFARSLDLFRGIGAVLDVRELESRLTVMPPST